MSVLAVQALRKNFGAVAAAADISLSFDANTVVSLIGANGAGKTTFLNIVTGYLKPDSGRIIFEGRDIVGLSPRQITKLGVARSFQIPQLFQTLSVRDNLLIAESIAVADDPQAEAVDHARMPVVQRAQRVGVAGADPLHELGIECVGLTGQLAGGRKRQAGLGWEP